VSALRIGVLKTVHMAWLDLHRSKPLPLVSTSSSSSSSSSSRAAGQAEAAPASATRFSFALVDTKKQCDEVTTMYTRQLEQRETLTFRTLLFLPPTASPAQKKEFEKMKPMLMKKCQCGAAVELRVGMMVMLLQSLPSGEARRWERGIIMVVQAALGLGLRRSFLFL
jgi:hypothetical protein